MRIGSCLALVAACLLAARGPAATLASCAAPASPHACCVGMEDADAEIQPDAGCPSEGARPCCRLTKPAPASPSVLTASGGAPALLATAEVSSLPPALHRAYPAASPRALARSSPPVSVLRI